MNLYNKKDEEQDDKEEKEGEREVVQQVPPLVKRRKKKDEELEPVLDKKHKRGKNIQILWGQWESFKRPDRLVHGPTSCTPKSKN